MTRRVMPVSDGYALQRAATRRVLAALPAAVGRIHAEAMRAQQDDDTREAMARIAALEAEIARLQAVIAP